MKRAFICNIVPRSMIVKLGAPQAPQNFCAPLIDGVAFDKVCSIIPISYHSKEIINKGVIKFFQNGVEANSKVGRISGMVFSNIRCAWYLRKQHNIWFYNLCKANIVTYLILHYIFRRKTFVILLDFTPSNSRFKLEYYLPFFYRNCQGIISLSKRTSITNNNILFKAGVYDGYTRNKVKSIDKRPTFLFSGVIANHTGFPLLLEVFKDLPDIELYISGNGDVSSYNIESYPNIHYLGYMEYLDYLHILEKTDVCLSLRNPDYPENLNNFPSRIIEYFSYNKLVISTINYPELDDFSYIISKYSKKDLIESIKKVMDMPLKDRSSLSNNQTALKKNFSVDSWINAFEKIEYAAR